MYVYVYIYNMCVCIGYMCLHLDFTQHYNFVRTGVVLYRSQLFQSKPKG